MLIALLVCHELCYDSGREISFLSIGSIGCSVYLFTVNILDYIIESICRDDRPVMC